MKNTMKQKIFHKKESERTRREKLCRDIACYGVTIFAALMGFLLVDANAALATVLWLHNTLTKKIFVLELKKG